MDKDRVYYVEVTFGTTVRKNCVHGLENLIEFLHHLDVMMQSGDTVSVYYHETVNRLDGYTSLQKIIAFDGGSADLAKMMASY